MARPKKEEVAAKKEVVLTEIQQKIWGAIKNVEIEYFGLPEQTIGKVCEPLNMVPEVLYLNLKSSAAVRSIEDALNKKTVKVEGKRKPIFVIEQQDKYTLVRQNPEVTIA
jgi:hypothetical protein